MAVRFGNQSLGPTGRVRRVIKEYFLRGDNSVEIDWLGLGEGACHPLNLGINSETPADPSAGYSVMTRGREHKWSPLRDLDARICWCFVCAACFGNSSATIHEIHIDPLSLYPETRRSILHLTILFLAVYFSNIWEVNC